MRAELRRLAGGALLYALGNTLNRLVSFLLLPLFTAYLAPADYGIAGLLAVLTMFLTPLFSLGLGTAIGVCYFDRRDRPGRDAVIWTALGILAAGGTALVGQGLLWGRAMSWLAFQAPGYDRLVVLALLNAGLAMVTVPLELSLRFEERVRTAVGLGAVSALVSAASGIVMVVFLRRGVRGLVESWVVGQAITAALYVAAVLPRIPFRADWKTGRELLGQGIPMLPSFFCLFVIQNSGRYLLQWFGDLDAVGRYTIGYSLGFMMGLLVSGLGNAWLPYFMSFSDRRDEARTLFGRIVTYYVLGLGSVSLLFYVAAKPVVMIMTAGAFHEAYKVVGLAASAQLWIGLYTLLLPGMYFAGKVRLSAVVQAPAAILSMVLGMALIPAGGVLGAGVALAGGALGLPVAQHIWNTVHAGERLEVQYEWRRLAGFAALYLGYAVAFLWGREWSLLGEILLAAAGAAVLPVGVYCLLTESERLLSREAIVRTIGRFRDATA